MERGEGNCSVEKVELHQAGGQGQRQVVNHVGNVYFL